MAITYMQDNNINIDKVKQLYADSNWQAYLKDDTMLSSAFNNSLYVYSAYDNYQLVGLVRCVGDGEHIVAVQDLIVLSTHQRQGIGAKLLQHICNKYSHVRTKLLVTDITDKRSNSFYQKQGWTTIDKCYMIAYAK